MRLSKEPMNPSLKKQIEREFAQVLADLKDVDEAETFMRDFFSQNDIETYAKRLAIAYWMKKNKGFIPTKLNLKVSSATVAWIKKAYTKPGFDLAIKKMEADEWANQWADRIKNVIGKKE
jgi:uncharacterized protein YerC